MRMKLAKPLRIAALVLALFAFGWWWKRQWPSDHGTRERIEDQVRAGATAIDLAKLTSFHWSKLYIFGPYTDQASAERTLGFKWPYKWSAVYALDDRDFYVFVDSGRVVAAFELPHAIGRPLFANSSYGINGTIEVTR
jgi:hypothetical protein